MFEHRNDRVIPAGSHRENGFPLTAGGNDSFAYAEILENAVQDILRAHRTSDFT